MTFNYYRIVRMNVTYHRIWNTTERGWDLGSPSVSNILEFLQSSLQGLAYNSLKGQIPALSAMSCTRYALHPLVI